MYNPNNAAWQQRYARAGYQPNPMTGVPQQQSFLNTATGNYTFAQQPTRLYSQAPSGMLPWQADAYMQQGTRFTPSANRGSEQFQQWYQQNQVPQYLNRMQQNFYQFHGGDMSRLRAGLPANIAGGSMNPYGVRELMGGNQPAVGPAPAQDQQYGITAPAQPPQAGQQYVNSLAPIGGQTMGRQKGDLISYGMQAPTNALQMAMMGGRNQMGFTRVPGYNDYYFGNRSQYQLTPQNFWYTGKSNPAQLAQMYNRSLPF